MKINLDKTLQVSDEQRKAIARLLDGEGTKKRDATRDEMKEFIWKHGASWESALDGDPDPVPADEPDEDLIGGDDLEDLI